MNNHAELNAFSRDDPLDNVVRVTVPGCLVKFLESKGITRDAAMAPISEAFVAGCSDCHNQAEFTTTANTPGYLAYCATVLAARPPANC